MSRQVFFCSLGGFDTHGAQSWQHWDLLRQVSEALAAFYNATVEMGIADRVTTLHALRFRPHAAAQRHRQRSRLGQPSPDAGRRGAGRQRVRHVPDAWRSAARTTPATAAR